LLWLLSLIDVNRYKQQSFTTANIFNAKLLILRKLRCITGVGYVSRRKDQTIPEGEKTSGYQVQVKMVDCG